MSTLTIDPRTAPTARARHTLTEQPRAARAPALNKAAPRRPGFLVALLRALSCLAA